MENSSLPSSLIKDTFVQGNVSEIPDDAKAAMLVGHNPGMEELLAFLARESRHMPTCALARISLETGWKEAGRSSGKLDWFVTPKDLVDD